MASPPSMIHAHKLEIQIPVLLAKTGFKITCKQRWHQCCKMVMLGRGRGQKKMHLLGRRGFLREFPWDEPGQWRSEDSWNLFCSRKESKILSAGRNTTVDDSIPTCRHTSEKITGFQDVKRSVVTPVS